MARAARFLSWVDAGESRRQVTPDVPGAIGRLVAEERQRTRDLDDPVLALRTTEDQRRHLMMCLDGLQADSARAVRALRRRGWSFARIAGETGLSNRRVAELARASRGINIVTDDRS